MHPSCTLKPRRYRRCRVRPRTVEPFASRDARRVRGAVPELPDRIKLFALLVGAHVCWIKKSIYGSVSVLTSIGSDPCTCSISSAVRRRRLVWRPRTWLVSFSTPSVSMMAASHQVPPFQSEGHVGEFQSTPRYQLIGRHRSGAAFRSLGSPT
jgi:hypothetical protein